MLLTKKKKPVSAYARYLKVRYHQYAKEYPSYSSKDINKLVINDWKNTITPKEKAKYEEEYREAKEAYL